MQLFPAIAPRRVSPGSDALAAALRPWRQRLRREALQRWAVRGAIAGCALATLVLAVGWVTPRPESELQPYAAELALAVFLAALLRPFWPRTTRGVAAELDGRLGLGDRLSTAWAFRDDVQPVVRLQRADAISRLDARTPHREIVWRPSRKELGALVGTFAIAMLLVITPSPQQSVLDRQAAEQAAVHRTSDRLDALRRDAVDPSNATGLTPEQARRLDELLEQAQAQLKQATTQVEATSILANTESQINQQLSDPNAALRDEALAAMSETLAAEPLTRQLGDALQQEDARAASQALRQLAEQADKLSDVQRQGLSRALNRAANVGRSDPSSANALREAARAIGAGESSQGALSAADNAISDAIQAANAQASLNATTQRLRALQAQLAPGATSQAEDVSQSMAPGAQTGSPGGMTLPAATPVAIDSARGTGLRDPSGQQGQGAGVGGADLAGQSATAQPGQAAENVFVPGREGNGPADQDVTDQPFIMRGAPRPYRDVLGQYAQTGRDYVDRPDVSPAVRDLVQQYFLKLEEGQ